MAARLTKEIATIISVVRWECPFCGGTNVAIIERTCDRKTPYNPADYAYPRAICKCGLEVPGENWGDKRTAIAAWNRRTATPQSGGVVVKGLEWEGDRSKSVVGTYATVRTPDGYAVTFDGEEIAHIGHNSVSAFEGARNAAQSHAQADYEARIRSTLADPIPEDPADEEVGGPNVGLARDEWLAAASSPQIERWALKWADVLLDALRRSTKTDKPGVREALAPGLEAAALRRDEGKGVREAALEEAAKVAASFGDPVCNPFTFTRHAHAQEVATAIRALSASPAPEEQVTDVEADRRERASKVDPDKHGHRTRFSDSSYFDEVCIMCGATDGFGDNRLNRPCPKPLPAAPKTGDAG